MYDSLQPIVDDNDAADGAEMSKYNYRYFHDVKWFNTNYRVKQPTKQFRPITGIRLQKKSS